MAGRERVFNQCPSDWRGKHDIFHLKSKVSTPKLYEATFDVHWERLRHRTGRKWEYLLVRHSPATTRGGKRSLASTRGVVNGVRELHNSATYRQTW